MGILGRMVAGIPAGGHPHGACRNLVRVRFDLYVHDHRRGGGKEAQGACRLRRLLRSEHGLLLRDADRNGFGPGFRCAALRRSAGRGNLRHGLHLGGAFAADDLDDQLDLLYDEVKGVTRDTNGDSVVDFTFDHLLSKAVFTFTNTTEKTTDAPANIYKVTDIVISDLDAAAVYDVDLGWEQNADADLDVEFGNIVASTENDTNNAAAIEVKEQESGKSLYEHLLIPGTHNVTISCNIVLYNGVADAAHVVKTIPYSETHTITLEKGKAYNFALSAGLTETIDFKVNTVDEWKNGNTVDGDEDGVKDHYPIL